MPHLSLAGEMRAAGSRAGAFVRVELTEQRPVGPLMGLTLGLVVLFSFEGHSMTCTLVGFDLL